MTNFLKRYPLLLTTLVCAIFLAGTLAYVSAHGGDIALIHACVKDSNGSLRIVGPNDACTTTETALDWNIQGLQGPEGPEGPQGPAGGGGEGPITVGGGVTGRWEGTYTFPAGSCNVGTFPLKTILTENSQNDVTGFTLVSNDEGANFGVAGNMVGTIAEPNISLIFGTLAFEGTVQGVSTMSGTFTHPMNPGCLEGTTGGVWSLQRVPTL